jgi:hypothetical protein
MQKSAQTGSFSPAFHHRAFVGRGEYTGAMIPRKEAPAVRFQKISPVLLFAPESPTHPIPCHPDPSPICDSGTLNCQSLSSPAVRPGLPSAVYDSACQPRVPCRSDSYQVYDSDVLAGLPSPAQAPALAPRFATPVQWPVPIAYDSRADPLSAARAGHPQRPWSIAHQVLLHCLADPAKMSP